MLRLSAITSLSLRRDQNPVVLTQSAIIPCYCDAAVIRGEFHVAGHERSRVLTIKCKHEVTAASVEIPASLIESNKSAIFRQIGYAKWTCVLRYASCHLWCVSRAPFYNDSLDKPPSCVEITLAQKSVLSEREPQIITSFPCVNSVLSIWIPF